MKKDKKEIPWDELKVQWAESMRRHDEHNKKFYELEKKIDKTLEEIRISNRKWGSLDNNIGFHAEHYFQESIAQTLTFGGVKFDFIDRNVKRASKKESAEFDIVLYNCDSVAIIEAKHRVHPSLINDMIEKKVPQFRKFFSGYAKHKIYLGVAGFSFDDEVIQRAKEHGIGVIKQVGKSIEIVADNLKAY